MTVPRLALSQSTSISNNSSSSESLNKTVLPLMNQNYVSETQHQKSSTAERGAVKNLSIAGSLHRFSKISRKTPLKTYSNSTDSRQTPTLSVLPHYSKYDESNNIVDDTSFPKSPSSLPQSAVKRSNITYNASESGEGSLLPNTITSSNSSIVGPDSITRNVTNKSNIFTNSIRSVSSPRRLLPSSISSVWSSNSNKSNEELPLHMQVNTYDKPLGNGSEDKPKFSLRSRRARISSYDKDDIEHHGYGSVDSTSYMTRNNSTGGIGGWLPWNTGASYSDCSTSSRHKIGKRRNHGNHQDYILPLTSTPNMFSAGGRRNNMQSYVKAIPQSHWIQTIIVLVATSLVWHSYQRTQTIQYRLEVFHDKESLSLLHLKTVEQHLVHLHENVIRLNDVANKGNNDSAPENGPEDNDVGLKKVEVDADLIRVQTQQLYQMEDELDHELRSLQSKIQHVARSSIVNAYGEGPVQVVLELNFQDTDHLMSNSDHKTISILLWYDTPHAAWTWLQQIRSGWWNDATFQIGKRSLSIDATPKNRVSQTDQNEDSPDHLKFIEKSKKTHEPWTIGLTQTESGLGMFINLQDNSVLRKNDVCVGKIIDGFDALQLLVDSSRRLHGTGRAVTIKNAFATHLARGQTQGIETIF